MSGFWRERVRGGSALRKKPIAGRQNEDTVLCRAADGLIGVFDGIGAYSQARMASQIARERCTPLLRAVDKAKHASLDEALKSVSLALFAAQAGVEELQRLHPYAGEGGTTAALAKLWQPVDSQQPVAIICNIGDSRVYRWNATDKRLERLTEDDNIIRQWRFYDRLDDTTAEQYSNLIDEYTGAEELPLQVIEAWEQRNTICAWLGMPDLTFDLGVVDMFPGDKLVAMSDGIHDNLTTTELARIIGRDLEPRELAVNLVDVAEAVAALDESVRAKPDDMSVAVLVLDA